jgi:hypothetical protein
LLSSIALLYLLLDNAPPMSFWIRVYVLARFCSPVNVQLNEYDKYQGCNKWISKIIVSLIIFQMNELNLPFQKEGEDCPVIAEKYVSPWQKLLQKLREPDGPSEIYLSYYPQIQSNSS